MTVDFSGVFASWDRNPPNYSTGELMRVTITGQAVNTPDPVTTTEQWGPFDVPVTAGGQFSTVSVPAATVTRTVQPPPFNENVLIDAAAGSTLVLAGRTFTVSSDRKSLTATA